MESYPCKDIDAVFIPGEFKVEVKHMVLPEWAKEYIDYIMLPGGMISDRIEQMAHEIYQIYKDEPELTFLVVMNVFSKFMNYFS